MARTFGKKRRRAGARAVVTKAGKIVWGSPGLVFPVLGAMSEFVQEDPIKGWKIVKPTIFKPNGMVRRAVVQFRSLNSDPMLRSRSSGVYGALRIYPATLVEVIRDLAPAT